MCLIRILVHKHRSVAVSLALIALGLICVGCKSSPRHPPTFNDFKQVGWGLGGNEKEFDATMAFWAAAGFLPRDIEVIRANGDAQELVAAALQVKVGDKIIPTLLREARQGGSNNPVVLAGIARSLTREISNQVTDESLASELEEIVVALEQLEPENGLPLCLRAYLQLKQGNTNSARLSLKAATQKPVLRLYGAELRQCVIQAAHTVNYPRFTASLIAIGTSSLSMEISILLKTLLSDAQLDQPTAEGCLEIARKQEAQATLFIDQLLAFSTQKRALEFLKPPGFEVELQRMADAKDVIAKTMDFFDSAEIRGATERDLLAFFDMMFDISELEAVKALATKLNYRLGP